MNIKYQSIITIDSGKRGGKPCIRHMRISVYDVLDWMSEGLSVDEIWADYEELTQEDVFACLAFAADLLLKNKATITCFLSDPIVSCLEI